MALASLVRPDPRPIIESDPSDQDNGDINGDRDFP